MRFETYLSFHIHTFFLSNPPTQPIAKHPLDFPLSPIVFSPSRGPQKKKKRTYSHFLHHRRIARCIIICNDRSVNQSVSRSATLLWRIVNLRESKKATLERLSSHSLGVVSSIQWPVTAMHRTLIIFISSIFTVQPLSIPYRTKTLEGKCA